MKTYSLLPIRKKGKDSKKPNTRLTYTVRSIRTPSRTREAISASLDGSPLRPSTTPRTSASLEGSEPTLGVAS